MSHLSGKIDVQSWFPADRSQILTLERAWIFARMCSRKIFTLEIEPLDAVQQCIPGWGGFHAILQFNFNEERSKTTVGYNPVVPNIPTHMNTIYTGMKMIKRQMQMLGQDIPVITLDLQLYIVAQEI